MLQTIRFYLVYGGSEKVPTTRNPDLTAFAGFCSRFAGFCSRFAPISCRAFLGFLSIFEPKTILWVKKEKSPRS